MRKLSDFLQFTKKKEYRGHSGTKMMQLNRYLQGFENDTLFWSVSHTPTFQNSAILDNFSKKNENIFLYVKNGHTYQIW